MMSFEKRIFDPHGDVVLIFSRAPEFKFMTATAVDSSGRCDPQHVASNIQNHEQPSGQISMLVSSKHMILASSVFAAMLKVEFKEGRTLESKGQVEIILPDDDSEAFTILLNIIHGHLKKAPRRIDLPLLRKLSILVDKYQMQEVVGVFSEIWIRVLKVDIPKALTTESISWLCISWVFGDDPLFKQVTERLMRTSDSGIDEDLMKELPIPEAVIAKIQYERRQGAILNMLQAVDILLNNYHATISACKRTDGEKSACDAMVLGSLLKATQKARLWPSPTPPYKSFTVDGLQRDILAVEIQTLCDITDPATGLKVHKGQATSRCNSTGVPAEPYNHYSSRDSPLTSKLLFPYNQGQENLKASQAVKDSITSMINPLSDKLCGLSIEDFK